MAKKIKKIKVQADVMTLSSYLVNFAVHRRNLDKVVMEWFRLKNGSNPKKTKKQWDEIIKKFKNEIA